MSHVPLLTDEEGSPEQGYGVRGSERDGAPESEDLGGMGSSCGEFCAVVRGRREEPRARFRSQRIWAGRGRLGVSPVPLLRDEEGSQEPDSGVRGSGRDGVVLG